MVFMCYLNSKKSSRILDFKSTKNKPIIKWRHPKNENWFLVFVLLKMKYKQAIQTPSFTSFCTHHKRDKNAFVHQWKVHLLWIFPLYHKNHNNLRKHTKSGFKMRFDFRKWNCFYLLAQAWSLLDKSSKRLTFRLASKKSMYPRNF